MESFVGSSKSMELDKREEFFVDNIINLRYTKVYHMESLLETFIREKLDTYKEPVRRGLPKGSPIGFTYAKYKASLLFLTNNSQTDIAHGSGSPLGTIRVWRTQEEFLNQIEKNRWEFAHRFIKRMKERVDENVKRHISIEEPGFKGPLLTVVEFKDLGSYHSQLIKLITNLLIIEVNKKRESELLEPKLKSHHDFYFFVDAYNIFSFAENQRDASSFYYSIFLSDPNRLKEEAFKEVKQVLWNPEASQKERCIAELYLNFLRKMT
jgi:hypothetical protein